MPNSKPLANECRSRLGSFTLSCRKSPEPSRIVLWFLIVFKNPSISVSETTIRYFFFALGAVAGTNVNLPSFTMHLSP